MTPTTIKTTMRRKLTAFRTIAELGERFPDLPEFAISGGTGEGKITFSLRFWAFSAPGAFRKVEGKSPDDVKREAVERQMTAAMDAIQTVVGRTLEWTKNDPTESSYEEHYYTLEAPLSEVASILLIAEREVVCERVVVLTAEEEVEEKDPELVAKALEGIPFVTVKKPKQIVEWQCNPVIAAKTNPVSVSVPA